MPPRPNIHKWSDVQTVIAMAAIVTTIGLWNLFASPSKAGAAETQDPAIPPTEPPASAGPVQVPGQMPYVKIMFTQEAPQGFTLFQRNPQPQKLKKKNRNNGVSITQTRSS